MNKWNINLIFTIIGTTLTLLLLKFANIYDDNQILICVFGYLIALNQIDISKGNNLMQSKGGFNER